MSKETIELNANKRTMKGKNFKRLRQDGFVPAVLYGPNQEPMKLQMDARELTVALATAGGSQLIDLKVEDKIYPALVREVQRDSLRDSLIHVDLYAVPMDREIRTEIPIEYVNNPPLVEAYEAVLVTGTSQVEIECLPANLPASFEVDLSTLVEISDVITVGDLEIPEGVTILHDSGEMLATLSYMEEEEEEEEEELEDLFFDAEAVEVIGKGKAEEEEEFFEEEE